ncbi:MAG TPA: aromatic ring-hydroxylating dioxygenase subunit alpha [Chloroflexota bacterium]
MVLKQTENELLTQVSRGTPMGELMRRYWHPIAASAELDDSPFRTRPLRILGEDLVLFRDRSGNLGLITRYCPHRRVDLAIGVVEQDGLRCQYHGWKFNAEGTCVEQPFEDTVHPEDNFKARCGIAGYPLYEIAGLIFAYLGPRPEPAFPLWEALTWDNVVRDVATIELPCNWLQCQENSLDPVHVEWLHGYFGSYVTNLAGLPEMQVGARSLTHVKIGFDEFEHGIIKRRVLKGQTEADPEWAHGHPILFPHTLFVGSQFSTTLQFRVPMDDTHTYHVSLYTYRAAPGAEAPLQKRVPYRHVPLQDPGGNWILNYVFNQDYLAWITQGEVAQRDKEKLGESDRGIILFRKMLKDQIKLMDDGLPLMNVYDGEGPTDPIHLPLEPIKFGQTQAPTYRPGEAGESADAELIVATLATWNQQPAQATPTTAELAKAPRLASF